MWRHKKQNTSHKPANIFFKSVLIALFIYIYMYFLCILHIFLKVIILLCSNMFCAMFYQLLLYVCWAQVILCVAHTDVLTSKHCNTMDFYDWKLILIWTCKWIICKRMTKHTCWSVGVLLTCHRKLCKCDNGTRK